MVEATIITTTTISMLTELVKGILKADKPLQAVQFFQKKAL